MADDKSKRGGRDPKLVNIHQAWEVRTWTKKFACTEEELKRAVKAVVAEGYAPTVVRVRDRVKWHARYKPTVAAPKAKPKPKPKPKAAKKLARKGLVTKPKDPRYKTAWTLIVDVLKSFHAPFHGRKKIADAIIEGLSSATPSYVVQDKDA